MRLPLSSAIDYSSSFLNDPSRFTQPLRYQFKTVRVLSDMFMIIPDHFQDSSRFIWDSLRLLEIFQDTSRHLDLFKTFWGSTKDLKDFQTCWRLLKSLQNFLESYQDSDSQTSWRLLKAYPDRHKIHPQPSKTSLRFTATLHDSLCRSSVLLNILPDFVMILQDLNFFETSLKLKDLFKPVQNHPRPFSRLV